MTKTWQEYDSELRKDDWNLQVNRHYDEWSALYVNHGQIMRSGKGKSMEEAIEKAYMLVKEGR